MNRAEFDRGVRQASLDMERTYGPVDSSAVDARLQRLLDNFAAAATAGRVAEGFLLDPNHERRVLVFEAHFQDVMVALLAKMPVGTECPASGHIYQCAELPLSAAARLGDDPDRCLLRDGQLLGTLVTGKIRLPWGCNRLGTYEKLEFLTDLPQCLAAARAAQGRQRTDTREGL